MTSQRLISADTPRGKRRLIEAAARLAMRKGSTRSLVLREVAREAGLNHNTFYRHFDDVPGMMLAIVDDFVGELRQGLRRELMRVPAGEVPSPWVVGWFFDFALEHDAVFTVAFRERYGPPGPLRKRVVDTMAAIREDMIVDFQTLGWLVEADIDDDLRALIDIMVNEVFCMGLDLIDDPNRRERMLKTASGLFSLVIARLGHAP
ncbi:hypothetical protein T5B8_07273 [Salinisphaera sp. T5B8]|uniref:TetR family transcriptional regulator n=1 Tax=unclassified Salinisphaera TaxID=2649847 RepID=UPI003342D247